MTLRPLVLAGPLAAAALMLPASASAACSTAPASGSSYTVTCAAGTTDTVAVPAHVGSVTIEAYGGDGGGTFLPTFVGSGGGASGTLASAGPLSLDVVVGTQGASAALGSAGGAPGGGAGAGSSGSGGGGGGGRSSVALGATDLIVAGGGGGAGSSNQWGAGGSGGGGATIFAPDGQPGGLCTEPASCFPTGHGGTQSAPGAGEAESSAGAIAGASGSGTAGGAAGALTGGGGGGAGCFGGGGGGTSPNGTGDGGGGGGGGSTCVDASLADVRYPLPPGGDGLVRITYTVPAAPVITSPSSASFTAGKAGSFTVTASGAPTPTISLDDPADLPAGLTFASDRISGTPTGAGDATVTVRAANGTPPDATQALAIHVGAAPAASPNPTPSPTATASPTPTASATPTPTPSSAAILSTGGGTVTLPDNAGTVGPVSGPTPAVAVQLDCTGPSGSTCSGSIAVTQRVRIRHGKVVGVASKTVTRKIGRARYTVAAGRVRTLKVKLSKPGRRLLKRFHKLKVVVKVTVATATGPRTLVTRKVTLRARH